MINKAISLALLTIYPMLGGAFAAAFIPWQIINTGPVFWLAMIYGSSGILAAIHIKALSTVAMQPVSTGLILGGLTTILGVQGIYLFDNSNATNMFFSLLVTVALIIYLAYKKVNKSNKRETLLEDDSKNI